MNKKEKQIKELGFRKKWFNDKSSYWWVKPFKLGEFKAYFYYDDVFSHIYVHTLNHKSGDIYEKSDEIIWTGSYNQLIKKVKKYGNI